MSSYLSRACRSSACRASLFFLLIAALAFTATAQQGRGFLAAWHLDDATPLGPDVRVRLSLRISNFTGVEYSAATLRLLDPLDPGASLASIPVLLTPRDEALSLSTSFTIPAREFRRWQNGASPNFVLEFRDRASTRRSFPIELVRTPLLREAR